MQRAAQPGRAAAAFARAAETLAASRRTLAEANRLAARARWALRRAEALRAAAPGPPPAYRVEWRGTGGGAEVLAVLEGGHAHWSALEPFAAGLRLAGRRRGELALVDPGSGAVLARADLAAPPRRRWGGGAAGPRPVA
jgi:hypothetical protein